MMKEKQKNITHFYQILQPTEAFVLVPQKDLQMSERY